MFDDKLKDVEVSVPFSNTGILDIASRLDSRPLFGISVTIVEVVATVSGVSIKLVTVEEDVVY